MATPPDIIEDWPETLLEDENGFTTSRRFTVLAESQLDARARLFKAGIKIGVAWRSGHGERPEHNTLCRSIEIDPSPEAVIGGVGKYNCTARYSVENDTTGGGGVEPVPGGPPVYSIDSSMVSTPADIDADGDAITNSADEPFDPPLTLQTPREILVVKWYVSGVTLLSYLGTSRKFLGALNDDTFHGAPRGSMLCLGVKPVEEDGLLLATARFEYQNPLDISLLPATVHVKIDGVWGPPTKANPVEGWMAIAVDRGMRVQDGVDASNKTKYKPIANKDGQPVTQPVDLDGAGNELTAGQKRVVRAIRMYKRYEDFTELEI